MMNLELILLHALPAMLMLVSCNNGLQQVSGSGNIYSVMDYGCKGDGQSLETSAINNTIKL